MERNLSCEFVSLLCVCNAHDAQYQWTDNIAIQEEHYLWQPPSEPLRIDQGETGSIKCNQRTSRSSRSNHIQCSWRRTWSTDIIPPCPEWYRDHRAVTSARPRCARISLKAVTDWIAIQWKRLVSEQNMRWGRCHEIARATHCWDNCSPAWF